MVNVFAPDHVSVTVVIIFWCNCEVMNWRHKTEKICEENTKTFIRYQIWRQKRLKSHKVNFIKRSQHAGAYTFGFFSTSNAPFSHFAICSF